MIEKICDDYTLHPYSLLITFKQFFHIFLYQYLVLVTLLDRICLIIVAIILGLIALCSDY